MLGAINITESLICVPSVGALLQSPLFISFCPSLLLFFFLGASGHRILFVTLRGARWQRILLASHLFPYLSPCLFPTCLIISLSPLRFFSLGAFGQRNLLVFRSVFFVLVALGTGLKSHLFSYSSLYFTLTCGCSLWVLPGHSLLLVLCLSPCLSPLFSPTRALSSLFLSLSLAVLLSRCLFGHMILFLSHLFAYLSPLFSPSCILNCLPLAILLISSLRLLSVLVS